MIAYFALAILFIVLASSKCLIGLFTNIIRKHSAKHGYLTMAAYND